MPGTVKVAKRKKMCGKLVICYDRRNSMDSLSYALLYGVTTATQLKAPSSMCLFTFLS